MKIHTRILVVLAAAFFAFAVSGCRSQDQWRAAAASLRMEYGVGSGDIERGKRDWDAESTWLAFSVQPFAYLDMEMRAERNVRAFVEAQYQEREGPR